MQLKANKFAHKIFIYCNVIIILLSLLIYLIILPQFDNYISKEKQSSLKQLNQMLSEKSKMYLDYSDEYADGYQGSTMYNTVSNIVNTVTFRSIRILYTTL